MNFLKKIKTFYKCKNSFPPKKRIDQKIITHKINSNTYMVKNA